MRRRGGRGSTRGNGLDAWPGYVDALSTLLMVIIFVLLVFVLAQAFLSVTLSGRTTALDRLSREMAQLNQLLSLEKGRSHALELSVATLKAEHARDVDTASTLTAAVASDALKLQAEDKLTGDAQGQVTLLNQQLAELQKQLAAIAQALDVSQSAVKERDTKITDLGNKLNLASSSAGCPSCWPVGRAYAWWATASCSRARSCSRSAAPTCLRRGASR